MNKNVPENKNELEDKLKNINKFQLIVYNDNVNSFQHVIQCFVLYCKHDPLQAEQCATIIHYNGKCSVKTGSYEELEGLEIALQRNKLNAKIEA